MDLRDPVTAAIRVAEALSGAGIPHALYGGLLLAAYGNARETRDVDMACADADAETIRTCLASAGLGDRAVFTGVAFGGLTIDRFNLWGASSLQGLNTLDVVRPRSLRYRAAALARAVEAPLRDARVRVLTPEDFVLFKVLSTRERDIEDAASVVVGCHGHLDRGFVRAEAALLAAETPDHDIARRLAVVEEMSNRPWA